MKTKLLKIVRKRYEIVKVTKFGKSPYFMLNDRDSDNMFITYDADTYDGIRKILVDSISYDYKHTSKRRQTKKEKQWWVK